MVLPLFLSTFGDYGHLFGCRSTVIAKYGHSVVLLPTIYMDLFQRSIGNSASDFTVNSSPIERKVAQFAHLLNEVTSTRR